MVSGRIFEHFFDLLRMLLLMRYEDPDDAGYGALSPPWRRVFLGQPLWRQLTQHPDHTLAGSSYRLAATVLLIMLYVQRQTVHYSDQFLQILP